MRAIITADNKKFEVECIGCSIAKKEVDIIGGIIAETENFILANDFEYPIPGFLIIGSKKHIQNITEFTQAEYGEVMDLLFKARKGMLDILKIEQATIIQEEGTQGSHFHIWLFPWYDWMKEIGTGVSSVRQIMKYAKENNGTKDVLERIISESEKLRDFIK